MVYIIYIYILTYIVIYNIYITGIYIYIYTSISELNMQT